MLESAPVDGGCYTAASFARTQRVTLLAYTSTRIRETGGDLASFTLANTIKKWSLAKQKNQSGALALKPLKNSTEAVRGDADPPESPPKFKTSDGRDTVAGVRRGSSNTVLTWCFRNTCGVAAAVPGGTILITCHDLL